MDLTDNSILTIGKHKFKLLKNVPKEYLITIYENQNPFCPYLLKYVNKNIEQIKHKVAQIEEPICSKQAYFNEKIAKQILFEINNQTQKHKKPIRVYECDKCGNYHLTSKPLTDYD
ncbi:hypothetical protein [Flavobacterium sp.]|uniref:hypothetical protein n=1 Tax=Flavobacterium sp. TaxID=239 RepID=UPI002B4AE1C4|nr:hypothetical protein [Flavobacterium sp.]HLF51889.1 hypothetical protein [Flavobacterium sp.]